MHAVALLSDVFLFKYYRSLLGAFIFLLQELGHITLLCGAQQLPQNAEILPSYYFCRKGK